MSTDMTKLTEENNKEKPSASDVQEIAALSQVLTSIMLTVALDRETSLNWQDAIFAAAIAIKGVGELRAAAKNVSSDDIMEQVRHIVEMGLNQAVETKRFSSQAEMDAWIEQGSGKVPNGGLH